MDTERERGTDLSKGLCFGQNLKQQKQDNADTREGIFRVDEIPPKLPGLRSKSA